MSTRIYTADKRNRTTPTFEQLAVGQWFIDDMDELYCKTDGNRAFSPNFGVAEFDDGDEVTVVEEIRIEIIK